MSSGQFARSSRAVVMSAGVRAVVAKYAKSLTPIVVEIVASRRSDPGCSPKRRKSGGSPQGAEVGPPHAKRNWS